jgi:myo-inositol-1-phosphate synthase
MPAGQGPGIERQDTAEHIIVNYSNRFTIYDEAETTSKPMLQQKTIVTERNVPRIGVMLVGLAGNNGSTFTAGIMANREKLTWDTKNGQQSANFFGSFTQSATAHVGFKFDETTGNLKDVHKPIKEVLPMANPVDFEISGWDISNCNLYEAAKRAKVLEPTLLDQLKDKLESIRPLKAILNPDYIAANQSDRADNLLTGTNQELIDAVRSDIRAMKEKTDKVVILWTANTEMFLLPEINTLDDLETRIKDNIPLPASVLYCVAAI